MPKKADSERDPMAESDPKAEPRANPNPLGRISRKPGSYVGDLDSLLAEVGDERAIEKRTGEVRSADDGEVSPPGALRGTPPDESEQIRTTSGAAGPSQEARRERPGSRSGQAENDTSRTRMKRINLDVPAELHQRFKGITGMRGVTMTEVLQELIRGYVEGARRDDW